MKTLTELSDEELRRLIECLDLRIHILREHFLENRDLISELERLKVKLDKVAFNRGKTK